MDIQTLRKMRNQDFSKIAGEFDKISNPQSGEKKSYYARSVAQLGNFYLNQHLQCLVLC